MPIDPTNDSKKEDLTNLMEIDDKKMTCKDGFCFLPNQNDNQQVNGDNINIFDPIWIPAKKLNINYAISSQYSSSQLPQSRLSTVSLKYQFCDKTVYKAHFRYISLQKLIFMLN